MRVLSITIVLLIAGFSIRAQSPIVTPLQQFMDFKLFPAEVSIRTLYNEYEVKGHINPYYKNSSSIRMVNWADSINWIGPQNNAHLLLPVAPTDIHFDMPKVHQIVMEVLEPKKVNLISSKEIISMHCDIDTAGRIRSIRSFTIKAPTILTIEEIDQISLKLKDQIVVHFTGKEYKQFPRIYRSIRIFFEKM